MDESDSLAESSVSVRRRVAQLAHYVDLHNNEHIPHIVFKNVDEAPGAKAAPTHSSAIIEYMSTVVHGSPIKVQLLVAMLGVLFTHAVATRGRALGANLAQAIVTTIGCQAFPPYAAPLSAGAYAGMASVLSADGMSYTWLLLLAASTAVSWGCVARMNLLVGYSGRLGTTAFCACNVAVLVAIGAGKVPGSVYYDSSKWDEVDGELYAAVAPAVLLGALATIAVRREVRT